MKGDRSFANSANTENGNETNLLINYPIFESIEFVISAVKIGKFRGIVEVEFRARFFLIGG
jgi:hypothetical protein